MSQTRFDIVVDLDDDRIAWKPLHEALEELDAAGFYPHRFHQVPEQALARVDFELGGTLTAELALGGAWIIERKTGAAFPPLAGCAGYRGSDDYGIAGPFSLEGDLSRHRLTILLGTLFSLRERGYHKALIPRVREAALPALTPLLCGAMLEQRLCPEPRRARVVVCASGNGSNFQAVLDAIACGDLNFDVRRLLVNRSTAFARERATQAGIDVANLLWDRTCESRDQYDERVLQAATEVAPDLVLLLGWMHLLPPMFVAAFDDILNIHPAYLPLHPAADVVVLPDGSTQPAFRGAHAVDDALRADACWIGASLHRVTEETDRGGILARVPLRVNREESREMLDERLHQLEHRVMLDALKKWATLWE